MKEHNNNWNQFQKDLGDFNAPFEEAEMNADWSQVQAQIGAGAGSGAASSGGGAASGSGMLGGFGAKLLGLGTAAIIGGTSIFYLSQPDDPVSPADTTAVSQQISSELPAKETNESDKTDEYFAEPIDEVAVNGNEPSDNFEQPEPSMSEVASNDNPTSPEKPGEISPDPISDNKLPSVLVSGQEFCEGETIDIQINDPKDDAQYVFELMRNGAIWSSGNLSGARSVALDRTGNYRLIVREIQNGNAHAIAHYPLEVKSNPQVDFNFREEGCGSYHFAAFGDASDFNWIVEGKQLQGRELHKSFLQGGEQTVMLIGNSGQCSDTLSKRLNVRVNDQKQLTNLPNIFTPNGDGKNDQFVLPLQGLDVLRLEIRNQQDGKLVFTSLQANKHWDGTNSITNERCPEGHYIYIINYIDECTSRPAKPVKGLVLLRRD